MPTRRPGNSTADAHEELCCCPPTAKVWIDTRSSVVRTAKQPQDALYRTDSYTIHWKADGNCKPLSVKLYVSGAVIYTGHCIPDEGQITLTKAYPMDPPYTPAGLDHVEAKLDVVDCARGTASCKTRVLRP